MKGRTERCMQADQHGRPAEPGQRSGQWVSVWIAARERRRSLGEGGGGQRVAGGYWRRCQGVCQFRSRTPAGGSTSGCVTRRFSTLDQK